MTSEMQRLRAEFDALRDSEARYRAVFEQSSVGMALVSPEGRFIQVNDRLSEIVGFAREELLQKTLQDITHADDLEADLALTRRMLAGEIPGFTTEKRIFRTDGTVVWVELTVAPLSAPSGAPAYSLSTIREISARKRAEQALQRANRALRTLSECNEALVRATDEGQLLREICRLLIECGGYRMAWVGKAEEDEARRVRPVAAAGAEERYLESIHVSWADDTFGRGPTGTAVRERRPVVAKNLTTDVRYAIWGQEARQRGYVSSIALPLLSAGAACYGALSIYAAEPDAFDAEEVGLLTELANDLAFGIRALRDRAARAETEKRLQRTAQRLKHLLNASPVIVYSLRLVDGRLLPEDVSENIERILGYSAAESLTEGWWFNHLHPDDRDAAAAANERLLVEGLFVNEYRFARKDGRYLWIHDDQRVIRDMAGAPLEVIGAWTDITERKRAEAVLRESEQRYRELFETNPQPMWVYDLDTLRFLAVNDAAVAGYGYRRDEFLAMTLKDIRPPEDVPKLLDDVRRERTEFEHSGPWRHRRKDGSVILVEVSSHLIEFGGRRAAVVLASDVTERLRAEAERRVAMEGFETLFRNAPEAISISETESGRFILVNDAFCAMLGYAREELIGRTSLELNLWVHPQRRAHMLAELGTGRRLRAFEGQVRTRAGELRDAQFSADRIEFGGIPCLLLMLVDVTERLRAQRQLEANEQQLKDLARRLMTKEEDERKALAQTLHDRFAQNLAAAKLGLERVLMGVAGQAEEHGPEGVPAALRRVIDSMDESIGDVRGLLAELRPPLLAEFGLRAALRREIESRASLAPGVVIELVPGGPTSGTWPPARLAPQVEFGLFMIAREALANALAHAQARRIEVELVTERAQAVIRVRDDGVGFDRARIQTHGHLGLTGMRERAALIGATLQIDSRIGGGTVVTVICDVAAERQQRGGIDDSRADYR